VDTLFQEFQTSNKAVVAFFYCSAKSGTSSSSPNEIFRSLIKQIAVRCLADDSPTDRKISRDKLKSLSGRLSEGKIRELFDFISASFETYLIIDGLDECSNRLELCEIVANISKI